MRLWDLAGDEPQAGALLEFRGSLVAFARGGAALAVADGKELRLWDLTGPRPKLAATVPDVTGLVAVDPTGKLLAVAQGGTIYVAPLPHAQD